MKLSEEQIFERLKMGLPDIAAEWVTPANGDRYAVVPADKIDRVAVFLKDTPELFFDFLMNVSAFDAMKLGENRTDIELVYHFYSYRHRHAFHVKVKTPRLNGVVNTLCPLYGCANFQEREIYDHFGVKFNGHPDLRRILLPDDWVGHPLLKDYQEQEEYNGIGTTRPSML